jgi:hypothetical protein
MTERITKPSSKWWSMTRIGGSAVVETAWTETGRPIAEYGCAAAGRRVRVGSDDGEQRNRSNATRRAIRCHNQKT